MNYTPQDRVFRTQVHFPEDGHPCIGIIDTIIEGDRALLVFEWAEFLDGDSPGEFPKRTYCIPRVELQSAPVSEADFEFTWKTDIEISRLDFTDETPDPGFRANPANFFQPGPDAHGSD